MITASRAAYATTLAALAVILLTPPASAQTYAGLVVDMRDREFEQMRERLLTAARRMPADLYDFRAAPEIRTFGEEINHAADVNFRLCELARSGTEGEEGRVPESARDPTTRADILARLVESLDLCAEALRALTDSLAVEPTFGPYHRGSHVVAMLGHGWSVYGKLTIMMRLNGIAPTAS